MTRTTRRSRRPSRWCLARAEGAVQLRGARDRRLESDAIGCWSMHDRRRRGRQPQWSVHDGAPVTGAFTNKQGLRVAHYTWSTLDPSKRARGRRAHARDRGELPLRVPAPPLALRRGRGAAIEGSLIAKLNGRAAQASGSNRAARPIGGPRRPPVPAARTLPSGRTTCSSSCATLSPTPARELGALIAAAGAASSRCGRRPRRRRRRRRGARAHLRGGR